MCMIFLWGTSSKIFIKLIFIITCDNEILLYYWPNVLIVLIIDYTKDILIENIKMQEIIIGVFQ